MKKFFEFTPAKFFLTAVLFALFAAISPMLYGYVVLDAKIIGLPLPFSFQFVECTQDCQPDFFWLQFFLDLLFWYVISSLLFHLNKVLKSK